MVDNIYLSIVRNLRHRCSEEIPKTNLLSNDSEEGLGTKAHKDWSNRVQSAIMLGYLEGDLPLNFLTHRSLLLQYWHETRFFSRSTTKEDINRANKVLDLVLDYLTQS